MGAMGALNNSIEKISDFLNEHKKLALGIIIGLALLLLILIIGMVASGKKETVPSKISHNQEDPFMLPQNTTVTEDYYYSRTTGEKWDDEQVNQWFTIPGTATVEELGRDNDVLVQEILGAAP